MDTNQEKDRIGQAIALAGAEKPAYAHLFPFLEALFLARADARANMDLELPLITSELASIKWDNGFPLLNRWDFPIDAAAAERVLKETILAVPEGNRQLADAIRALTRSIPAGIQDRQNFWHSFLHHEMEPWEEWISFAEGESDPASLLFVARSAIRPSLEQTAELLVKVHPVPGTWLKGYCPICGSFPSLLLLEGDGERKAFCSWCATKWDLHRLQCPYCDNRFHESLGYLAIEEEAQYRITYCNLCKHYFKQIDTRQTAYPPYLPLEEWTTLHLDLVAQKSGWKQPPSPAPAVYGQVE